MKETITIGNFTRTIEYNTETIPYYNPPDVLFYGTIFSTLLWISSFILTIAFKEYFITDKMVLGNIIVLNGYLSFFGALILGFSIGFIIASFKARIVIWNVNRNTKRIMKELRANVFYELSKHI